MQAGTLKGEVRDVLLLDVVALGLGIELSDGQFATILPRNAHIPARRSEVFTTGWPGPQSAQIPVCQLAPDGSSTRIGLLELSGLARAARHVNRITVTIDIDANGRVEVQAADELTGRSQTLTLSGESARESAEAVVHDDRLMEPAETADPLAEFLSDSPVDSAQAPGSTWP